MPNADGTLHVALIGNPNAGKTSLFNALTGSSQKVANFPGVTVERVSATLDIGERTIELLDVPGLYSMNAVSEDEIVAVHCILGEGGEPKPDALVCVIDATNLERNLFFFSQVAELGLPLVVALTMTDSLKGETVDVSLLKEMLGVQVVPVVSHKGKGLGELRYQVRKALDLETSESGVPPALTIEERYCWASEVTRDVLKRVAPKTRSTTEKLDGILTHRVLGLLVFFGVMYIVFTSIYFFAEPLMGGIEAVFDKLSGWVGPMLAGNPMLQSLVVDGLINGVASVLVFLPQILILFFFISALEGSGYLARAAFLMDRLLGWAGLSGRAFVPLLSSYACAIPGVMAARVMPDPKSRLATILVAPLMSCSARLPIYVLLIGAVIEPQFGAAWAGFALFAMHLVGLVVAIPVVLIINRGFLKTKRLPFLLELPRYQWPKWRDVGLTMFNKAKAFVQTAGTIIVVMSVLIWAALYFPHQSESELRQKYAAARVEVSFENYAQAQQIEGSYLGQFGHTIEPVFRPAGFDWRISTAILAAFPAREVIVPSLSLLFGLGDSEDSPDLRQKLQAATWPDGRKLFTPSSAVGLMLFFSLCCQCMSTLATVRKETGTWKWPAFMFGYMTALAYIVAVLVHQLAP